ncbi:hypothetical protein [Aquiflexum sp.]|uniref:hypothetical protein n=1 Tax=Aquiflexum sp. TaxID=1872584 RepID=UPI0035931983
MKAVEFESKIKNNKIEIPAAIQAKLVFQHGKAIRVIVLMEGIEVEDDLNFKEKALTDFFKGYSSSDAIYDEYK